MKNKKNLITGPEGTGSPKDADLIAGLKAEIEDLREKLCASDEECARLLRVQCTKDRWEDQGTQRRSTFFVGLGFGLTLSIFLFVGLKHLIEWIGIDDEFTVSICCLIIIEALAFIITMYHLWLAKAVDRLIRCILKEADDDMVDSRRRKERKNMAEEARNRAECYTVKRNGRK